MAEARAYSGNSKVYKGTSRTRDIMRKEIARREDVRAKRKENPKYKGMVFTLGALSLLSGILTTRLAKSEINSKQAEQEISSSANELSNADEITAEESIGDAFTKTDISEPDIEETTPYIPPELPQSNINEVLDAGMVVEFNKEDVGFFEQNTELGGAWVVNNEKKGDTTWCRAFHRESGNYGYTSMDALEEFKPCASNQDNIYYRTRLDKPCDGYISCAVGDTVFVDTSTIYKSPEGFDYYKYLIQNEYEDQGRIKYDYSVVYSGTTFIDESDKEYSLGLVKNKTAMRTSPEIIGENIHEYGNDASEKGVKYIVDISSYTPSTFPDYMDTLKTLKAKGLLGGVIMEIARSHEGNGFSIGCMTDGADLDAKNNSIAGTKNETYTYSMGDYNQFKNYIEQTMQICPVGFYVFVDTIDQERANQLADIVYETEKKLSNDIEGYNEAKKFPLMIDVETGDNNYRQERTDTSIGFINRLSKLGVIKDQYMFYTAPAAVVYEKARENSGTQITCIEDVKEGTPGLSLINVGACYVDGMLNISSSKDAYKNNMEPENLLKSMYASDWYTKLEYMSHYNIAYADVMQCMGNINNENNTNLKLNSQVIDISACTTDTYNAILNGTFKEHEGSYLANMDAAIQRYKSINENNIAKQIDANYNSMEQDNERG